MLIAIDHGNKQVKTVHGNAIVSGVQKSKTRPYGRDILKYGGSYYTLSAQRIPYQKDKTTAEGSLSCRYLPLRRKSKHRTLILPG